MKALFQQSYLNKTNFPSTLDEGVRLTLDNMDVTLDSQAVYTKAKLTLGGMSVDHAYRRDGVWQWGSAEGVVMTSARR